MRKPYLIRTPDFDPTSGGIRVMYGLYGWLLSKGEIAYLNTQIDVPSIGIYPEIYHGNDMKADKVVRWILQTPGIMATGGQGGPLTEEILATSDDIYVFSKIYDTVGVDNDHILFLPILNTNVFNYRVQKRSKTCYLVGKGKNQNKHPFNSFELTREFAQDQQALANLLNECDTLYCYDRLSAMMDIARLCGCKVRYYGDFSKDELSLYETGMNGITYKDEDEVELKTHLFQEHYMGMKDIFSKRLDKFIEESQK